MILKSASFFFSLISFCKLHLKYGQLSQLMELIRLLLEWLIVSLAELSIKIDLDSRLLGRGKIGNADSTNELLLTGRVPSFALAAWNTNSWRERAIHFHHKIFITIMIFSGQYFPSGGSLNNWGTQEANLRNYYAVNVVYQLKT